MDDDFNSSQPLRKEDPGRSLLQRAGARGLSMGLYLIGLALLWALSLKSVFAAFLWLGGSLYFPFYMYKLLVSGSAETSFRASFAELWAEGIATLFFGSALQAAFIYIGLKYIDPGLIQRIVAEAIASLQTVPDNAELLAAFTDVGRLQARLAPLDVMMQVATLNLICGSVLSFGEAFMVVVRYRDPERCRRYLSKHKNTPYNGL